MLCRLVSVGWDLMVRSGLRIVSHGVNASKSHKQSQHYMWDDTLVNDVKKSHPSVMDAFRGIMRVLTIACECTTTLARLTH